MPEISQTDTEEAEKKDIQNKIGKKPWVKTYINRKRLNLVKRASKTSPS